MLLSLSLIFLVGMSAAAVCKKLKLPGLIGMLITGIVLGPYVLDLLDPSILGISSELRQIALIIILIRAGLSLNISDLKKVGRPALLMSFVPACFEILSCLPRHCSAYLAERRRSRALSWARSRPRRSSRAP